MEKHQDQFRVIVEYNHKDSPVEHLLSMVFEVESPVTITRVTCHRIKASSPTKESAK